MHHRQRSWTRIEQLGLHHSCPNLVAVSRLCTPGGRCLRRDGPVQTFPKSVGKIVVGGEKQARTSDGGGPRRCIIVWVCNVEKNKRFSSRFAPGCRLLSATDFLVNRPYHTSEVGRWCLGLVSGFFFNLSCVHLLWWKRRGTLEKAGR